MHEVDLVLQRFDSLIEPFEELMLRIGDKTFLPINELREAQAQFRSIKENLDALYKDLQRRQMTDIEKRFLLRPVAKARSKLHAKWNSNPFKSQWFPQLYDAKDDLKRMRFELEEFRKKI